MGWIGAPQAHAQFEVWLGDEGGQVSACFLLYPFFLFSPLSYVRLIPFFKISWLGGVS